MLFYVANVLISSKLFLTIRNYIKMCCYIWGSNFS